MQQLHKFWQLSASDRNLLLQAAFLLNFSRLGLRLLPFHRLRQVLARIVLQTRKRSANLPPIERLIWAIEVVSRYLPGHVKCLARALATQGLLTQYGYPAQLRLGVIKDAANRLVAHAWVESQGQTVIGGSDSLFKFTALPALEIQS